MITKTIAMTEFGPLVTVGNRDYTDEQMKAMHALWLKVFVQARYEQPLMAALEDMVAGPAHEVRT